MEGKAELSTSGILMAEEASMDPGFMWYWGDKSELLEATNPGEPLITWLKTQKREKPVLATPTPPEQPSAHIPIAVGWKEKI